MANNIQNLVAAKVASGDTYAPRVSNPQPQSNPAPQNSFLPKTSGNPAAVQNAPQSVKAAVSAKIANGDAYIRPSVPSTKSEPFTTPPSEAFQSTYDKAKDRSKFANSASEFAASSMSSFMGIVNWAANGLANGTRLGDQSTQWLRDFAKSTDASADKWEQKTAAYNYAATENMGKVGTLIHDLAINALPMLADMGISALLVADDVTGVGVADDAVAAATAAKAAARGSKIWNAIKAFGVHADDVKQARQVVSSLSMAARVFGQEYNRNEDSMTHAQATLRAGISSAIEAATEKIFDFGLPGAAYGGGKTIEKVATEAAAKAFGKHEILAGLALSIAGEGAEEVLSDLGNALVDYQFEKAGIIGDYDELTWSGVAYDFLVGGLLGMLGTGENVVAVHEVNANQRLQQMKNAARQEARQAADDRLEKGTSVAEATEIFEEGGADEEASENPSEAQEGSTQQQTQTTPTESDTAQAPLLKTKPENLNYEQLLRLAVQLESEGRFEELKLVNEELALRQSKSGRNNASKTVDSSGKIESEKTPSVADQIVEELVNNESTEDDLMYMNEPYDPDNVLHEYRGAENWIFDDVADDYAPYYSPATTPGEYASAEIFGRDGYLNFKAQLESHEKYIDPITGHLNEQGRQLLDDYLKNMTEKGRKDTAAKNRTDATEAADADYEEYMAQVPELEPDGSNYRDVFKKELDALWEYCEAVGLTEDEANNICNDYYHHQMTLKNAFRQARLTADAEYSNGEVSEVTDSHHEKTQHDDYREDFLDAEDNRRFDKDGIHDVDLEDTWLPSARAAEQKSTIPDGAKNSTPDEYPNEIHDWDKFSESYLKRKLNEISSQGRELKAKVDNFAGLVDVPEGMGAGKMFRSDKAFREYANLQRELNELRLDYKYIKANLDARHKSDYVRSYTGEQISYDGKNVGFSEYEDAKRRNADNGIDVFADDFDENGGIDNGTRGDGEQNTAQEVPRNERRRLRDSTWHRRRHNGGGGDSASIRGNKRGAKSDVGRVHNGAIKEERVRNGTARTVIPDTDNKGSIKFSPESAIVTTYNEAEQKIVDAAKDINAYLPHSKFSLMLALGRVFSGDYEVAGVNTNAYGNADGSRTIITNINDMVAAIGNIKHEFTHEAVRNIATHAASKSNVDINIARSNIVNALYTTFVESRVLSDPERRQARTQTLIKYYFKAKGYNLDRYDNAASENTRAGYRKEAEEYYEKDEAFRAKVNEEFLTNAAAGVFGGDIAFDVRTVLNDYMQTMFDASNIDKTGLNPQVPDFYSAIDSIDVSNYEVYDAPKWKPKDGYTKAVKWVDTDDELANGAQETSSDDDNPRELRVAGNILTRMSEQLNEIVDEFDKSGMGYFKFKDAEFRKKTGAVLSKLKSFKGMADYAAQKGTPSAVDYALAGCEAFGAVYDYRKAHPDEDFKKTGQYGDGLYSAFVYFARALKSGEKIFFVSLDACVGSEFAAKVEDPSWFAENGYSSIIGTPEFGKFRRIPTESADPEYTSQHFEYPDLDYSANFSEIDSNEKKSFDMPPNKWGEASTRIFEAAESTAYRVAEAASKGMFSQSALNAMRTTAEEAEVALNDYSSMIESFAIGDIGAVEFASYYRGLKDDDVNSMFYFENLARRLDALEEAQNEIYANGTPSFEDEDRFHRQAERAFRSIAHYTEAAMQGAEDAKAMSDSIKEHFGGGKDLKGFKKVLKKAVDVMGSYQLTPSTVFKMISGFSNSDNAVGYRYAKRVDAAVANRMATETEARSYFNEFKQRKGYYKWASGESKTGVIDAIGTEMTQLDAAHFIKNIDTLGGVTSSKVLDLDGFKIGDTFYEMSQFEDEDGDAVGNLSDMYNQVKAQLDEDSQAYLDSWFDAASYFAPRFQETSEAVEGNAKEVLDLDTYFPVYYANKDGTSTGWSPDVDGADSSPQGVQFTHSATMRSRNAGGYLDCGPITEAVDKYISSMSDYVAFAQLGQELQMMNRNTVFGDKASSAIGTGIDDSYARWFENYVGDINKFTDDSAPDAINDALKRGRLAVQTGSLLFSMSVQMKQISSYWAAMAVLSPTAVVGSWRFKELTAKGNSRGNALADSRLLGADPSEYEVLNNKDGFLGKLKRKSKAFNDFANLTTIKDFRTVDNLFDATVMQVKMDNPGIDEDSAKFERLVNDKFAEVLLRTQPIFVKQARAEYARTDNEFIRLTSMFRSQQTQNLNLIVTAIGEYTANKGTELAGEKLATLKNTLAGQATSVMSLSLLSVAADLLLHKIRKYDDDNDKEIDDSAVLTRIGLNAIESAAGTVAFGDAFAKYAIDLITQDTDEFKGFNLGALSTIKNSMDAIEELVKFPSFTNARVAAGYIAQSFGIPMNNAYAILNSAFMYTADLMGENPYGYDDMIRFLENQSKLSDEEKDGADMTQEQVSAKIQELVADAKAHEAETGYYNGMKIMNYILELDTPTIDLDDAAESYLNEKQYAAYGAIRSAGYNPTETFDVFKEIDADHNTSLKQAEVFQYYLDNPVMEDIARAIWNSYGWKTSFDDYKKQNSK